MKREELARLILRFIEENQPEPSLYNDPTIDEMIEAEPYSMLRELAYFLRGDL